MIPCGVDWTDGEINVTSINVFTNFDPNVDTKILLQLDGLLTHGVLAWIHMDLTANDAKPLPGPMKNIGVDLPYDKQALLFNS